jgi:hypothetical protein
MHGYDDSMIDFDAVEYWESDLADALRGTVSDQVRLRVASAKPEFVEDARDVLFSLAPKRKIVDATLAWIRSNDLLAYHGTRLAPHEVHSIQATGLRPLKAEDREPRLARALSSHPRWLEMAPLLPDAIRAHGEWNAAGHREGQVHLTLSGSGLTNSFNHYLTHGSEFDQHVAFKLLGKEGADLLALDGSPMIVKVALSGTAALDGAHVHFTVEDMLRMNEVPNVVKEFLETWAFRLAFPGYRPKHVDCGIWFRSVIPASQIIAVESLSLG